MQSEPLSARTQVWALPGSLAATSGIDVSFSSSGYLDVSVHRVPDVYLWIQYTTHEVCSCRFPHSDISGSLDICSSPKLFAAYHVFHRLLVPRHPPCALISLTKCDFSLQMYSVTSFGWFVFSWFSESFDSASDVLYILRLHYKLLILKDLSIFGFQCTMFGQFTYPMGLSGHYL